MNCRRTIQWLLILFIVSWNYGSGVGILERDTVHFKFNLILNWLLAKKKNNNTDEYICICYGLDVVYSPKQIAYSQWGSYKLRLWWCWCLGFICNRCMYKWVIEWLHISAVLSFWFVFSSFRSFIIIFCIFYWSSYSVWINNNEGFNVHTADFIWADTQ